MTWATPLYEAPYDFPLRDRPPEKSIMVAGIGRTGSTFLCAAMWRTGGLGAPMEYLHLVNRKKDMIPRLSNGNLRDYWRELQLRRTSPNGVFAYKAFIEQFRWAVEEDAGLMDDIKYDAMLYITRKDKLAQAVSLSKALQAEAWFADAPEKRKPVYSDSGVMQAMGIISYLETGWETYFQVKKASPLKIYYEDLIARTDEMVNKVADFIGVDPTGMPQVEIPPMVKQRDSTSEEWTSAFKAKYDLIY